MKIFLLNPPIFNTILKSYQFPLGLGYIVSVLEKNNHDVFVMDATAPYNRISTEEIVRAVKRFNPTFIGLTFTMSYIRDTYEITKELKKLCIPLVAGGPHPTALPEEVLQNGFYISVRGEGESTVLDLVEHFEGRKELVDIDGISYKNEDGEIVHNKSRMHIPDINTIPFPAWHRFPIKNYTGSSESSSNQYFWRVFSSRGCPFNCIYCSAHGVFGRKYRLRSPENLMEEIDLLRESYNMNYINFVDDEAVISKKRLNKLCEGLKERKIMWNCRARVTSVNKEMLTLMKDSGCVHINYGAESGNQETLNYIRKKQTVDQIKKAIEATIAADIPSFTINNLVGFPWENEKHIIDTFNMNYSIPRTARCAHHFNVPYPMPATDLYDDYVERYEFKEWWLKEDAFEKPFEEDGYIAFFKIYRIVAPGFFYLKKNFFNYTKTVKRIIIKNFKKSTRVANKRIYGSKKEIIINILCKMSLFLYSIHPSLEKKVFSFLRHKKVTEKLKLLFEWEK